MVGTVSHRDRHHDTVSTACGTQLSCCQDDLQLEPDWPRAVGIRVGRHLNSPCPTYEPGSSSNARAGPGVGEAG
jgi:hypothetical protein